MTFWIAAKSDPFLRMILLVAGALGRQGSVPGDPAMATTGCLSRTGYNGHLVRFEVVAAEKQVPAHNANYPDWRDFLRPALEFAGFSQPPRAEWTPLLADGVASWHGAGTLPGEWTSIRVERRLSREPVYYRLSFRDKRPGQERP